MDGEDWLDFFKKPMDNNDYCSMMPEPNSDEEFDINSRKNPQLEITDKREMAGGFIINSGVYISEYYWNTLVQLDNVKRVFCAVCDLYINYENCGKHLNSPGHKSNIIVNKPLKKFELCLTRQITHGFHCGVCNVTFDDPYVHGDTQEHSDRLLFAINKAYDLLYDRDSNVEMRTDKIVLPDTNPGYQYNEFNLEGYSDVDQDDFDDDEDYRDGNNNHNDNNDLPNENQWQTTVSYADKAKAETELVPKELEIDLGDKLVTVEYDSWHMIVYTARSSFYCMACQVSGSRRAKTEHCGSEPHLNQLRRCKVVRAYETHLVRRVGDKLYHCGHCNNLQTIDDMEIHIKKKHPKLKLKIDKFQLANEQIVNGNFDNKTTNTLQSGTLRPILKSNVNSPLKDITKSVHFKQSLTPPMSFPETSVPNQKLPEMNVPTQKFPETNVTPQKCSEMNVPTQKFPEMNVPTQKFPEMNVPTWKVRENNVPSKKVPEMNVPTQKFAEINVSTQKFAEINVPTNKNTENNVQSIKPTETGVITHVENKNEIPIFKFLPFDQPPPNFNNKKDENGKFPLKSPNKLKTFNQSIIMTVQFGFQLYVSVEAFNTILKVRDVLTCLVCDMALSSDPHAHIVEDLHIEMLQRIDFIPEFTCNLIRMLRTKAHCAICNKTTQNDRASVLSHISEYEHSLLLNKALFLPDAPPSFSEPGFGVCKDIEPVPPTTENEILEPPPLFQNSVENLPEAEIDPDKVNRQFEYRPVIVKLRNVYLKIMEDAWHTIVFCGNGTNYCFCCNTHILNCEVFEHMNTKSHNRNLDEHRVLDMYGINLLRQMENVYHCAFCNTIVTRKWLERHLNWAPHKMAAERAPDGARAGFGGSYEIEAQIQKEKYDGLTDYAKSTILYNAKIIKKHHTRSVEFTERQSKVIVFNDKVYNVDFDNWNGFLLVKGRIKCVLCNVTFKKSALESHYVSKQHGDNLDKPFYKVEAYGLIRELGSSRLHCVLCNIELSRSDNVSEHAAGRRHRRCLENAGKGQGGAGEPIVVE